MTLFGRMVLGSFIFFAERPGLKKRRISCRKFSRARRAASRVFLMHRVDELSYREIHECLGISIATVEYHMMRALGFIAKVVDGGQ